MLSTVDACSTDSGYALIKGGAQRFRARFGVKLYGATNYYHYQCFSHVGAMRLIIYAFLRGAACCSSLPTRKHGQQTLMAIGDRTSATGCCRFLTDPIIIMRHCIIISQIICIIILRTSSTFSVLVTSSSVGSI